MSILFVDVVGFTGRAELLDPEEVGLLLTPFYGHVRAELERFGGTVEKFIGDAVMAIFGVPAAHEDDPERAVRAAFGVRRVIEELNATDPHLALQVRIGIATGEVLTNLRADPSRGETTVAGDIVNTAARLQQTAPPGAIVVGRGTYEATSAAVEYRALEPVAAKGKRDPVVAWEAAALRSAAARTRALDADAVAARRQAGGARRALGDRRPGTGGSVGPGRDARRRGRARQVAAARGAPPEARRRRLAVQLAPGALPPLRRGSDVLGVRRDRQGAGGDPRDGLRATSPPSACRRR